MGLLLLLLCAQTAWSGDSFFQSTDLVANGSRFEVQKEFTSALPNPVLSTGEVRENPGDYFGSGHLTGGGLVEETVQNFDFTSMKNKLNVLLNDSVQLSLRFFDYSKPYKPAIEYAAVDSFSNDPMEEKRQDQLSTFVVIKVDF